MHDQEELPEYWPVGYQSPQDDHWGILSSLSPANAHLSNHTERTPWTTHSRRQRTLFISQEPSQPSLKTTEY